MATTRSSSSSKPTETREVDAHDQGTGTDRSGQTADPPRADGVPAEDGAVADENTGPGPGPMADGSPAPKGA
jgi:hypothetical protein